jgi:hypothetical membrane protein
MTDRQMGFSGIAAWILFWSATVVFGALRPAYSHIVNTVTELGAVGTPNAVLWNVFGFIVPGVLSAVAGVGIARAVNPVPSPSRTAATVCLALAGLAIAGQGLMPAEMVNGVADVTSLSTRGHSISSLVSAMAWAVGALTLVGPMKRDPGFKALHIVSVALVVLGLMAALTLRGTLPDGLAQRIGNAFFCLWFVLMSLRLVTLGRPAESASPATS